MNFGILLGLACWIVIISASPRGNAMSLALSLTAAGVTVAAMLAEGRRT